MNRLRLAITVALEALEVGDQWLAVDVLLGALEGDPQAPALYACDCGQAFEWPGLRAAHVDSGACRMLRMAA